MRVNTVVNPQWLALVQRRASLEEMQEKTGKSQGALVTWLTRWLRRTGGVDVTAWLAPELADAIRGGLSREPLPSMQQLAGELGILVWPVRLVAAAQWNQAHAVAQLPAPLDGAFELEALLAQRWSLPELVRATGLHPATLEGHIAAYLAAQTQPDASAWLSDAEVARVSALLDGPNAWHNLRRAQARGETTRGQVAMVLALRGQWKGPMRDRREPLPKRNGRPWAGSEDVVVGAAYATDTPLAALARALQRTPGAVLVRAVHLGLLTAPEPLAWAADHPRAA